jgi:hypothetical protein
MQQLSAAAVHLIYEAGGNCAVDSNSHLLLIAQGAAIARGGAMLYRIFGGTSPGMSHSL